MGTRRGIILTHRGQEEDTTVSKYTRTGGTKDKNLDPPLWPEIYFKLEQRVLGRVENGR